MSLKALHIFKTLFVFKFYLTKPIYSFNVANFGNAMKVEEKYNLNTSCVSYLLKLLKQTELLDINIAILDCCAKLDSVVKN